MMLTDLSLIAVFLTGLLGGVHCAGMCGGIVSALGMFRQQPYVNADSALQAIDIVTDRPGTSTRRPASLSQSMLVTVLLYNAGRISTYTLLGFLAGGIGSTAWLMQSLLPVQQAAFFLSSVLLIFMGLYVMGFKRVALLSESLGSVIWQRIGPSAAKRLGRSGALNSVVAGALWGLVPCGMVYAALGIALVSGAALKGSLLMLVFGLGTLPNLMALGMAGQWLGKLSKRPLVRKIAGVLIIGFGLLGFMHLMMQGTAHH